MRLCLWAVLSTISRSRLMFLTKDLCARVTITTTIYIYINIFVSHFTMSIFGVFAVYRWLLFVRLHIHKTHAPRVHTENIHFEFGKVVEIN